MQDASLGSQVVLLLEPIIVYYFSLFVMQETLRQVKARACAAYGAHPNTTLVWDYFLDSKYVLLEDQLDCTVGQIRLVDQQPLLLERKSVSVSQT